MRFFHETSLLFGFVLVSRDWYRASSKHRIIIFQLASLLSWVSSRASQGTESSSFYFLLYFCVSHQLRLFSTSHPWAVWRKASRFLSVFFILLSLSAGVEIFSSLYNFSVAHAIFAVILPAYALCVWTCLLFSIPPTQITRHFCGGNTGIMFIFGNRSVSGYATNTISATCQKGKFRSIFNNIW